MDVDSTVTTQYNHHDHDQYVLTPQCSQPQDLAQPRTGQHADDQISSSRAIHSLAPNEGILTPSSWTFL